MRRPYVLMLGTGLSTRGGVASVACTYRDQGVFERWGVAYLRTHASGTPVRKICIVAAALLAYTRRLVFDRPALVHVHLASGASCWRKLPFVALARLARVPLLLHVHGGGFVRFYQDASAPVKALLRAMLESAQTVIALSPRWRERLLAIAPRARVEVLLNPAAVPPAPRPAHGCIPGRIGFLGQLAAHKGVFELLQAFATLADRHPEAHLVLGGEGDRAALRECMERLGIDPQRVRLAGWLEGAAKDALLDSCAIFALPSHVEGLPVCVLEAMAHAVPVVASEVGGLPDIVSDGVEGLLVPPGDVPALAQALRRLLEDPAAAHAMGLAGHARARREFEPAVVCSQLESTYARLIAPANA